ncbi:MAG TPA: barstar family protein [Thermoanaerobaculia bacterium]|nr:barstar family protein [Thermoanaerobaculia bacterium]
MILGELAVHFATEEAAEALLVDDTLRISELPLEAALFDGLAQALHFPDYFGSNWDAVEECLGDIETDERVVLLVHDAAKRWERDPKGMATLVGVWTSAATERGGDLHLVFVW